MQWLFGFLMFCSSVFLILLVLVQRGRGGGLAGAFGGMGGQSAFGTKAGDLFTRITIGVATFWILLCITAIAVLNKNDGSVFGDAPPTDATALSESDETKEDAGDESSSASSTPGDGGDSGTEAEVTSEGDLDAVSGSSGEAADSSGDPAPAEGGDPSSDEGAKGE